MSGAKILTDFAAYALYSAPSESAQFVKSVEEAGRGRSVNIKVLLYQYDDARETIEKQFPRDLFESIACNETNGADSKWKEFARLCREGGDVGTEEELREHFLKSKRRFRDFVEWYACEEKVRKYEGFVDYLWSREESVRKTLMEVPNCKLRGLKKELRIFVWQQANPGSAVFALQNDASSQAGMSFWTQNEDILREFREIFAQEWKAGIRLAGSN